MLGLRAIFSPLGGQHILLIHQGSPIKEISQVIDPVIIQAISQQGSRTILHPNITAHLCNLCQSIIVQPVAIKKQRISLHHFHITKSLKAANLIIVTCTVAIHVHTIMTETHISGYNLCVRMTCILTQQIRMQQIDFAFSYRTLLGVLWFLFPLSLRFRARSLWRDSYPPLCRQAKNGQAKCYKKQKNCRLSHHCLIHPGYLKSHLRQDGLIRT